MYTLSRKRLVDKLVEAYVAWRETCARVDDAYRSWASETGPCGGLAFGLYMAALDAEEQAAEVYAGLVRRAEKLPWTRIVQPSHSARRGELAGHDCRPARWPRQSPADVRLRAAAPSHGRPRISDRRRILVCDAESQSLHALRVVLHGAGFEVDVTRGAAQALDRGALRPPTAAIIELVLPDGDGVEVCRRLREWSAMPVILLSAVGDEREQVRAFEAGADDYVTKPFRPHELVARLLANLRRAEPGADQRCVELDGLEIDLAARAVRRDGEVVHLTPIEFSLLAVLTQNRGRLLTHNALLQQVWGAAYTGARQTLRAHIANLRRKIEPADGERLIRTDHGVGYRLADVHAEGARRGGPAEEVIDRELVGSRVSALPDPKPAGWPRPPRGCVLDTPYGRVA